MGKINVLDKQLSELIAAGEVVERPASVVKELVENSLDAGATEITVEIESGGIRLIRVTDNGSGISREDVKTAFLRHATSKIKQQDDLDAIATLGFRGEALAAISAVSRTEIITRTADEIAGTRFVCEGGSEVLFEDTGCACGTSMFIRDLFYNTPARMKFLKKDVSEANAISAVLDKIALSHPEVGFKLIRDGKTTLNTPGDNKLSSAIYSVLGRDFSAGLLPVKHELGGVGVIGYICKPTACRANRNMQYFFINGRLIKSRTIMAALEQAYKNMSMTGKFPACVLHLSVPYGGVDVNVHPAKIEVRFSDEKRIFDAVYYAVKTTISAAPPSRPTDAAIVQNPDLPTPPQAVIKQFFETKPAAELRQNEKVEKSTYSAAAQANAAPQVSSETSRVFTDDELDKNIFVSSFNKSLYSAGGRPVNLDIAVDSDYSPEPTAPPAAQIAPLKAEVDAVQADEVKIPFRVVGEIFSTYILIEQGEEFILLDKHAAHERIIFNELVKNESPKQQMLLEPVVVSLPREEYDAVITNLDLLGKSGYEIEDLGGSVMVRALPSYLSGADIASLISEAAGGFIEHKRDAVGAKMDWLYHSVSCRAAIKAGDRIGHEEMVRLAERVLYNDDALYCPHGRPVTVRYTKKTLEKQFGRIQ